MTKTRSTKRALLMSALALLMCVSMLIGSTFAWFTDSVTSSGNKIVAGTLDIQLLMDGDVDGIYDDISNNTSPIFGAGSIAKNNNAETLWEPGKTQVAYLAIKNNGNLALKYTVGLNVQNVNKDLYEVMEYAIVPDADANNKVTAWNGGNAVTIGTQSVSDSVSLAVGATHYFALVIHMNEEAGNEYQGGEVNFDLTVLATQDTVESDSFGNQYDANAQFATTVSNAAQLQAALNAGENVVLGTDIDLTGVTWTPAGATAETAYSGTIDGNGHKIIGLSNAGSEGEMFGLIAYGTGNVTVKNLVFDNVNINGAGEYAAAVMGLYVGREGDNAATYNVTFENITVNGTINASDKAAAILGCNYRSSYVGSNKNIVMTFNNCENNAAISGASRNGGIAGAVTGEFAADGRNSEIKVVFNNCVNNGTVASTSTTYKTGAIVGFASGDGGNYEFNNCVNNGTADGDLLGRLHASISSWSPTTSSDTTFMYLDFVPQDITIFDAGSIRMVSLTFKWIDENGISPRIDNGTYRTGTALADDEWRITVDGEHYRIAMNTPFDGINDADCVVDSHNVNPADVENHWTGSEYSLESHTDNGSGTITYVYNKTTPGK